MLDLFRRGKTKNSIKEEREFTSTLELRLAKLKNNEDAELRRANIPIRARNRIRKSKEELEKKALEFFQEPAGLREVAIKICQPIIEKEKIPYGEEWALIDAATELIINPMVEDGTIELFRSMKQVSHLGQMVMICLYQDASLAENRINDNEFSIIRENPEF